MSAPVRPVLILGTHMLSLEMADLISDAPGWRVDGFVENLDRERCVNPIEGLPVHWIEDVGRFAGTHHAICGISTTRRDAFIAQAAERGLPFATFVHPTARVSGRSSLGEGTFVSAGSIVAAYTRLGRHVFVNRGVLIGHHTTIDDFATIQPGANVAGACHVGNRTYIGLGAIVLDRLKVGARSIVGAGSLVTRDVPDDVQVMGAPARVVKDSGGGK
jgi:sugar O-acyltransferase (sialic acid O-acetyltransferase NeuD family)